MRHLMLQYKQTLKETRVLVKKIENKLNPLEQMLKEIKEEERPYQEKKLIFNEVREKLKPLQEEKRILNEMISTLVYSIKWMSTGRQPGTTRGIENRAAYDREINFEHQWIERRSDRKSSIDFMKVEEESEDNDFDHENKVCLVKEIQASFNKKEREVLELSANGYTQREIGEVLSMPHTTVANVLSRCKRKIEDEGWFML